MRIKLTTFDESDFKPRDEWYKDPKNRARVKKALHSGIDVITSKGNFSDLVLTTKDGCCLEIRVHTATIPEEYPKTELDFIKK